MAGDRLPHVSAVLIARREGRLVHAAATSLRRAVAAARQAGWKVETILAADMSFHSTAAWVRDHCGAFDRVIELSAPTPAEAVRAGIEAGDGKWISVLPGDSMWSANWLADGLAAANAPGAASLWRHEAVITYGESFYSPQGVSLSFQEPTGDDHDPAALLGRSPYAPSFLASRALARQVPYPLEDPARNFTDADWWWSYRVCADGHRQDIVGGTFLYRRVDAEGWPYSAPPWPAGRPGSLREPVRDSGSIARTRMVRAPSPGRGRHKRILVTGASGFIGRSVCERLAQSGHDIVAVSRQPRSGFGLTGLHLEAPHDAASVEAAVDAVRPDVIVHLAGSAVASDDLEAANVVFARNVLDAARRLDPPPRVIIAGSAAEYGNVAAECLPVTETFPCRPVSDYGRTKLRQSELAMDAARAGLPVVVTRMFNVIGPGMPHHLLLGRVARDIAAMPGGTGTLILGRLDARRDFVSVAEISRLFEALIDQTDAVGMVLNIASGIAVLTRTVVDMIVEASGLAVTISTDRSLGGVNRVGDIVGSQERLRSLGLCVQPPDLEAEVRAILEAERTTHHLLCK